MENRVPTIYELAEQAERRQQKAQPQAGQRELKPARKASGRTSRRPQAKPQKKRKG